MVVVVLWHSSLWMTNEINKGKPGVWFQIGLGLVPLRMPLFFFISGHLAARAVRRPLDATRGRTLGMMYLYVVWTAIFVSRLLIPQARGGGPIPAWYEWVLALALPTSFWYLYCLAAYFLLTHVMLRRAGQHVVWLLLPLAALSVIAPLVREWTSGIVTPPLDAVKASSLMANLVWFVAGTRLVNPWAWLMQRARWIFAVAGVVLYGIIFWAALRFGAVGELSWHMVPLSVLGLVTMSQILALTPMKVPLMRLLQRIGRDTLPIYTFHLFLISLVSAAVKMTGLTHLLRQHLEVVNWVVPPLMTLAILPTTRLVAALIRRSPVSFLLEPPEMVTSPRHG